uniref:Uncharacterized protein n=1 Tax=Zea mays TaxID=4577 RepID=A0A804NVZ3_MAIZE
MSYDTHFHGQIANFMSPVYHLRFSPRRPIRHFCPPVSYNTCYVRTVIFISLVHHPRFHLLRQVMLLLASCDLYHTSSLPNIVLHVSNLPPMVLVSREL